MSNKNVPLILEVSTQSLRALLEGEPETLLKLKSFACEKIADELHRKAVKGVTDQMAVDVQRELDARLKALLSRWHMPQDMRDQLKTTISEYAQEVTYSPKIKGEMERVARGVCERQFKSVADAWERQFKSVADAWELRMERQVKDVEAAARAAARSEFLTVLREHDEARKVLG